MKRILGYGFGDGGRELPDDILGLLLEYTERALGELLQGERRVAQEGRLQAVYPPDVCQGEQAGLTGVAIGGYPGPGGGAYTGPGGGAYDGPGGACYSGPGGGNPDKWNRPSPFCQ